MVLSRRPLPHAWWRHPLLLWTLSLSTLNGL
jgi:hypothetical protein